MNVTIKIGKDEATRDVAAVYNKLTSESDRIALMKVLGISGEQVFKRWFQRRDADSPNKMGWPRQHFWARLARATAFDPSKTTSTQATINVSDPALGAKISGATITAGKSVSPITGKPTQNIAIPMNADAYGRWPRGNPIAGLVFIRRKGGAPGGFLVTVDGKGKDAKFTFYYRLVPKITVPKDPRALPPPDELGAALAETAKRFYDRRTAAAAAAAAGGTN